jgi:hypothetical protein
MGLVKKIKDWRQAKRDDRAAIATARQASMRDGDEPGRSMADTIDDVAGRFPPPS